MTTYCPWLTLSHMLFAHLGFAKKLSSSKQPCSKITSGLHQHLLLMAAWPHQATDISLLGATEFTPQAAWCAPGPGLSHAQICSEVLSWVAQVKCCNGLCRGATRPPPTSTCEVPPFSAGQQLNFCKFGPFLLLFKLCFRHELHSEMLRTSPPGAPPITTHSSMQLSKELLR